MQDRLPDGRPLRSGDNRACRALLRGGSRTFYAASFLLPREVREPASALYAFCRLADDEVDQQGDRAAGLDRVRERLARAYDGRPVPSPIDRAFADVVARFALPRALPEALLEGFAWDVAGHRYHDLAALQAYAARVAGAVGAMMAVVMGARAPELVARACDLGVAMQLTNIARDVGEDARLGRVYLPLRWLADAGIDPDAWLARPAPSEALGTVIAQILDAASALYDRVDGAIDCLPPPCRPGIRAARALYAEIGAEVRRRGHDSISSRAVVPGRQKVALIAHAVMGREGARDLSRDAPLTATRFLVDAVVGAPPPISARPATPRRRRSGDRIGFLIDLFDRLERRDAIERPGVAS